MRRKSLGDVYRHFLKETQGLLVAFNAPVQTNLCEAPHRLSREMCVVRLDDAWVRACKELVMASAVDEPLTMSGSVVPGIAHASRRTQVLPFLLSTFSGQMKKPPWWRPDWGTPRSLLDTAKRLGLANYGALSLGMSMTPNPTEDLRRVRNFLAHRHEGTAKLVQEVARSYQLAVGYTAEQLVGQLVPPGVTVFEGWILDLRTMLRNSVA